MFVRDIFIILKKAIDTVNHDILLHKLDHYGISSLPNTWLQGFLLGRSQYRSIKDKISNKLRMTRVFHKDLKHLCQWLKSNKISLNASKTEIKTFKHK